LSGEFLSIKKKKEFQYGTKKKYAPCWTSAIDLASGYKTSGRRKCLQLKERSRAARP